MTDRRRDILCLAALLGLLILFYAKILFSAKIIRAPDITNEFYWTVKHFKEIGFLDIFKVKLRAGWDMFANGGNTEGGGTLSLHLLYYRNILLWLIPAPANIAWFIVMHLFFGGAGTYMCCRIIGASRVAALFGGLIFAIAPESATLINAGHVQKIATISFAPWAFYFLERGYQTRRFIYPLTTGLVLAVQFFNMHWQIAYYTCLGIGSYGIFRTIGIMRSEGQMDMGRVGRLLGIGLVTGLFFLSTVAISLLPLSSWSKETTRGVSSGSNQGKGGLNVDEAMSWSMPPEELGTLIVPGLFGFSRQEGGYNTADIKSYYWGRMVFTQTNDYMGLLPWLLLPLPLLFRRDRYTWLSLGGIVGGILFSLGRYTPFYWLLYNHFPGVNHFRVPKMMLFLPLMGVALLAARGLDCLMDEELRHTALFRRWLKWVLALPCLLVALLFAAKLGSNYWIGSMIEIISMPTRFEQGMQLLDQRWANLLREITIALLFAALFAGAIYASAKRMLALRFIPILLLALYIVDVGRVDAKFMLVQDNPPAVKGEDPPGYEYLKNMGEQYRVLPLLNVDPMLYASRRIPVLYTSNPVQMRRWQDFLDTFTLDSPMPDLMNVKYLICSLEQYRELAHFKGRFTAVYQDPRTSDLVVENRTVLPKAWLVPSVMVPPEYERLSLLQGTTFDPRKQALVETPPTIRLADGMNPGTANVTRYEGERIALDVSAGSNALLVLGDKYDRWWRATVDNRPVPLFPVDHVLRGLYLEKGNHKVEMVFDPLPFKIGKYLTLASLLFFSAMLGREIWLRRSGRVEG